MFFLRESLEVATNEVIAKYRAARFAAFDTVADLGCGIGGDAIGLALVGKKIEAVDRDPVRLAMCETNLAAYGFSGRFREADLLVDPLPDAPAAFADPNRRAEGKRFLALAEYSPPPAALLARLPKDFPIGFKLAPGAARHELASFEGEIEFIAFDGELKESVLWFGPLRSTAKRATLLSSDGTVCTLAAETEAYRRDQVPLAEFLYDPSPAVVRADLVANLAEQIDAAPVDPVAALLTSDCQRATPFAACYRARAQIPLDAKKIGAYLHGERIGRVTPLQRGSQSDIEKLLRTLKLKGDGHAFVIATQVAGAQVAIVAERV